MIVYAECEYFIPTAHSLKEKRAVLQRMLTRTKQNYNVSIAEIDHQNTWQRVRLGIVTIASSREAADRELTNALHYLASNPQWEELNIWRDYV